MHAYGPHGVRGAVPEVSCLSLDLFLVGEHALIQHGK